MGQAFSQALGQQLGHYRVIESLGQGGMSDVVKAVDTRLERLVAIKILSRELLQDADALQRFEREARAVAKINHPNIATVYDFGRCEDGVPYLVMEYIDGETIGQMLANRVELAIVQWMEYLVQAAQGLEAALRRGLIHRDIKPGNLMVSRHNQVKIVDFGLAKSLRDNTYKTATGMLLGTPRYMAPEQGLGRATDHRSDIYSLGATFYHVFTGRPPFEASTPLALVTKHLQAPLIPIHTINPAVPGDIASIVEKMLEKDPDDRYQDYESLIHDVRGCVIAAGARRQAFGVNAGAEEPLRIPDLAQSPGDLETVRADSPKNREGVSAGGGVRCEPASHAPDAAAGAKTGFLQAHWVAVAAAFVGVLAIVGIIAKGPDTGGDDKPKRGKLGLVLRKMIQAEKGEPAAARQTENDLKNTIAVTHDRLTALYHACERFETKKGRYPYDLSELVQSGQAANEEILDGWNRPMKILFGELVLVSGGENGVEDDWHGDLGDDLVFDIKKGVITKEPIANELDQIPGSAKDRP